MCCLPNLPLSSFISHFMHGFELSLLKFGNFRRHFPCTTSPKILAACTTRVLRAMAQFVLKRKLSDICGQPQYQKWHALTVSVPDYGSCDNSSFAYATAFSRRHFHVTQHKSLEIQTCSITTRSYRSFSRDVITF